MEEAEYGVRAMTVTWTIEPQGVDGLTVPVHCQLTAG